MITLKTVIPLIGWIVFLSFPVLAKTGWACPVCHTDTGALVRAGIFNGLFFPTLLITALPFPIFLAIAGSIYYDWPHIIKVKFKWIKP